MGRRWWSRATAPTATPLLQRALRVPEHERQSRVWSDVERYQSMAHSPTSSLVDQLGALEADQLVQHQSLPTLPGQSGVLIALGDQPLGLELFGSPAALAQHLPAIVQAARMDATMAVGPHAEPAPGRRARRMAARLELIDIFTGHENAGFGISIVAETPKLWVRGVATNDGRIAHLSALNITHPLLELTS
ncbi:MAG: DUF6569 family protein [Nakamurella sp.]